MKKIISSLFVVLFVFSLHSAYAQKKSYFEGSMDFMIKMYGKTADALQTNKPNNKMKMFISGGNYIISLAGGQLPKLLMFINDSNHVYTVDMKNERYFMSDKYNPDKKNKATTAKPTGDSLTIFGVKCAEYKSKKGIEIIRYYVSDKYKVDTKAYEGKNKARISYLADGLNGMIPLKTIRKSPNLTIEITVEKIKAQKLNKSQFFLPKSFERWGNDYRQN